MEDKPIKRDATKTGSNIEIGTNIDSPFVLGDVEGGFHNKIQQYAPEQKQSLVEAAEEIQKLLNQLSKTYSPEEAEQKAAEELADRAKQNPSFKENLKTQSKSLLGKGSETAVTEVVKRVIPLAMTMLVQIHNSKNFPLKV